MNKNNVGSLLLLSLMDALEWRTEVLGIYDFSTGTHQRLVIPEDSELAPAFIGLQPLDERRYLVRVQSMETLVTSLYTLPSAGFSVENLNFIQSFSEGPNLLHIPEGWPD